MQPQMFAIVPANDDSSVFSYGIDTGEEAFTFRRDPKSGRTLFSVHDTADRALTLANRITRGLTEMQLLRYPITAPLDDDLADDAEEDENELPERPTSYIPRGFSIEEAEDTEG
jgi:hypothetical protein